MMSKSVEGAAREDVSDLIAKHVERFYLFIYSFIYFFGLRNHLEGFCYTPKVLLGSKAPQVFVRFSFLFDKKRNMCFIIMLVD